MTSGTNETGPASGAKKAAKRIVDDIVERGWWTPDTPGDMETTVAVIARQIEADIRAHEPPPAEPGETPRRVTPAEAIRSATKVLLNHFAMRIHDSEAVSDCVHCNAVFLAKESPLLLESNADLSAEVERLRAESEKAHRIIDNLYYSLPCDCSPSQICNCGWDEARTEAKAYLHGKEALRAEAGKEEA